MQKSKKLAITLAAALSLFPAFPGPSVLLAPAVAEAEATGPLFMENLGWGLPLRVFQSYSGPEWAARKRHFPGIMFDGTPDDSQLLIASALEGYSIDESKVAEEDGLDVIKTLRVRRADSLAVSFVESCAAYGGGMRGRFGIYGKTYDTATGRALAFDDVFADREQLAREIAYRMGSLYPGRFPAAALGSGDYDAFCDKVRRVMASGEFSWSLDPFGATFYFNPGSLTDDPYDDIYTITFCFAYTPYHFRAKYRVCPEAFCMDVEPRLPTMLCFDESADARTEITAGVNGVVIRRNGEEFVDPGELEAIRPVFVMTRDRRKYLYVDGATAAMNPRHELRVYDLNGDKIFRVTYDGNFTMLATEPSEETQRVWHAMTDPDGFTLTRTDTPFLEDYRHCRLGENGAPLILGVAPGR